MNNMKIPFFNKKVQEATIIPVEYKPSIYSEANTIQKLTEQFKGEIEQDKAKYPQELGEEHPYDFKLMDELYKKFGFYTAIVDKYIDYIWGPGFYIKCDDDRAKEIIEKFMEDVDFSTLGRDWTKEGLNKGNGFLEIGGNKKEGVKGLKKLNANYMYVDRDNKGKIKNYNQYKGAFNKFSKDKVISFSEDNIAHFAFNTVGDSVYGLGLGFTAMKLVDDWLNMQNSQHQIMKRKANSPLHAQFGIIDGDTKILPKSEDISSFGKDLETMSNKTNWVTGPDVNFKVVDFGNVGDKFSSILQNDLDMLFYAFQIPPVIMGKANVPEGIAKVQMDAFQRRIQSIQAELEKVIEQKIFRRALLANGLDVHVEFEWGTPSIMQSEARLQMMRELVSSNMASETLRTLAEEELINLLKFDKDKYEKMKLEEQNKKEEERKRLEQQPQPQVPGQNKNFPQPVPPKKEQPKQPKPEEILSPLFKKIDELYLKINEINNTKEEKKEEKKEEIKILKEYVKKVGNEWCVFSHQTGKKFGCYPTKAEAEKRLAQIKMFGKNEKVNSILKRKIPNYEYINIKENKEFTNFYDNLNDIQEWLGFSYKKYLGAILEVLTTYEFNQIKALNENELEAGYLSGSQINILKNVLGIGFREGKGIREITNDVNKKVKLKDLYRMNEDGTIKKGASGLPILSRSADKRAISIVRTEITRAANMGAEKYYKDNGITYEKWIASFGGRTCDACAALDGTIYKIGESRPGLPLHPLCRCTLAPVVDLKSKGEIKLKEKEENEVSS
jgi:SPP1 gp7 family putative phage head morphogenesis protein